MSSPRAIPEIVVRHCTTLEEFEECVLVEHATWGKDISVVSSIFVVAYHTGGQVLGAFDGKRLIGFTLALIGVRRSETFLHSHMTAVLPEFRDRGVGRQLKLFQREDALKRGIKLVEWTFDPLEAKNAYFNLMRLGAVARRWIPNCYGITESPLHGSLPTDRLVAEWRLDSERVRSIVGSDRPAVTLEPARIEFPADFSRIRDMDLNAAIEIQSRVRDEFQALFAKDYVATGIETRNGVAGYMLEPRAEIAGLILPELTER
ncbi:MAG TPA: GNAT family N-acetyltransferase [Candidatus Aquilonibacter sp.]|nr:GNAT family N-acetyltransferase [Candidatus Aquilonibacter sp.]